MTQHKWIGNKLTVTEDGAGTRNVDFSINDKGSMAVFIWDTESGDSLEMFLDGDARDELQWFLEQAEREGL